MAGDLGSETREVHAQAAEVLGFWFDALMPEQHFARSDAVDAAIRTRFADLRAEVKRNGAAQWRDDPSTLLAAVIVLDQFSRNLFRGQAEAFATDALALSLRRLAMERGWDRALPPERRHFLYMPLMHAEDAATQAESVAQFAALSASTGDTRTLEFAREHQRVIADFGRFPGRNAALGRVSTPEEEAFLNRHAVAW